MELYPELEQIVDNSKDRLYSAAKVAIAGNVIDFGIHLSGRRVLSIRDIIEEIKDIPLSKDDFDVFLKDLADSRRILYLADNAGEIVFDRIFIEQLVRAGKKVILAISSGPVLNDALHDDAKYTGLDGITEIIETGNNCIGVNFESLSNKFLKYFDDADLIISKGQGNFETLDEIRGKKIFFLLKAKCEKIARELGIDYLDTVFMKSKHYK